MSRRIRIRQLALSLAVVLLFVGLAKTASAQSFVITEPHCPAPTISTPCHAITLLGAFPVTTGEVVLLQPLPGTSSSSCPTTVATTDPSCWSDIVLFATNATGFSGAQILSDCNDADCHFASPLPGSLLFRDEFSGGTVSSNELFPNHVFLVENCSPTGNGTTVYTPSAGQPGGPAPGGAAISYAVVSDCEPFGVSEPSSFALLALSLVSFVPFALLRRKRLQATAK